MRAILVVAAVTGATLLFSVPAATAACAPPEISVTPATGAPGEQVTLAGQYFFVGCTETEQGSVPGPPDQGIKLQFVQGTRTVELGTVNADDQFRFQQQVEVPRDATDGDAAFHAVGRNATASADFRVIVTMPLPTSTVVTTRPTTTSSSTTSTSSTSTTVPSTTTTTEAATTTTESSTTSTSSPAPIRPRSRKDNDSSLPLVLGALGGLVVVGGGLVLVFRRLRT